MSIIQQSAVWYSDALAPNQRLVALGLADFADDTGRCYPSMQRLADKCGYSRRQTSRIVAELRDLGYVTIVTEATPRMSPIYQLHPKVLDRADPTEGRQSDTPPDEEILRTEGRQYVTPGATPPSPRDDTDDTPGATPMSPSPSEDGQEPSPPVIAEDAEQPEIEGLEIERIQDETTDIIPRPRNLGWDAMVGVFGYTPEGNEAKLWGQVAAKANRETDPAGEVIIRATRMVAQWGAKSLTPGSLNKWWTRFGTALGAATEEEAAKLRDELEAQIRRRRAAEMDEAEGLTVPPWERDQARPLSPDDARATVLDVVADVGDEIIEVEPEEED